MEIGVGIGISSRIINIFKGGVSIEPTSAYTLNFAEGSYSSPTGAVTPFTSLLSHSRTSAIIVPTSTGTYQTFGAGVPAINNRGLWLRAETRTNSVKNNSMVGAVAGTPGTFPTDWIKGGIANGMSCDVVETGASHPQLGLPFIRLRYYGTTTAAVNHTIAFGQNAGISVVAGERWVESCWVGVSGMDTLSNSGVRLVSTAYGASGTSTGALGTVTASDKLMSRDTAPRRLKNSILVATSTANAPITMRAGIISTFKTGVTYDMTITIVCPMIEKVIQAEDDSGLPILTTTTPVTYVADTLSISGDMLTMLQGSAAGVEIGTDGLRGSNIDNRKTFPLIVANSTLNLLERTEKGELSSQIGGSSTKTYRSWRSQFGWTQKHRVQWGGGKVAVASTSPAHKVESNIASPTITSVSVKVDGCISKLVVDNGYKNDLTSFTDQDADLIVYGATSGGIVAAASSIMAGRTAIVVGGWREVQPGGMASGGLGAVDASVAVLSDAFGGISLDYAKWCNEYSGTSNMDNKSIQAAHALLYFDYLIKTHKINQRWTKGIVSATKTGSKIIGFRTNLGQRFTGKEFIDCGYEGDLMYHAGVSYRVGREAQNISNAYNGNRGAEAHNSFSAGTAEHQFTPVTGSGHTTILNVDPYITPGNSASGLVAGVQSYPTGVIGEGDAAIQAYNFRITATRAANRVSFYPTGAPEGYSAARYELLGRWMGALATAGWTGISIDSSVVGNQYNMGLFMLLNGVGNVYDINSNNGFSTDTFGANWGEGWASIMTAAGIASPSANYAVGSNAEREIFWKWQESHVRGLFYYLGESNDARIPLAIKNDARSFGLAPDYYLDPHENDQSNWMTQLYVREARALLGKMVLEADDVTATDDTTPRSVNVIGAGSYAIDSHHVRRYVDTSTATHRVICEGNIFVVVGGNKRFPIAMEYIMPIEEECSNLLVTFAASARHTGFGALRMEMAHMAMSEAAALMAKQRILTNVGSINYTTLRPELIARGLVVTQTN